jgi:hypothetical protein
MWTTKPMQEEVRSAILERSPRRSRIAGTATVRKKMRKTNNNVAHQVEDEGFREQGNFDIANKPMSI